jgi:hypothetical protein
MTAKETDDLLHELNDIGLAYKKACRELERGLAANPHRDRVAARNALTLEHCHESVRALSRYLVDSPGFALWQRLANALRDRIAGAEPALFFNIGQQIDLRGNRSGITVGARMQGLAALVLDALTEGGFKKAEAETWLNHELRELQIKDEGGDLLTGRRISVWRDHFRRGEGSKHGREGYNEVKKLAIAKPLSSRHAVDLAHELLMMLKLMGDHELPKAQRKTLTYPS